MPAANFTIDTAQRILTATRRVEKMPQNKAGERLVRPPAEPSFWAYLTSAGGLGGQFWSWIKVTIAADLPTSTDPLTVQNVPLFGVAEPHVVGFESAREANGQRDIATGTIVRLEFCGYDKTGEPAFLFTYTPPGSQLPLPLHDHRDNVTGLGFAFATYHPGTALPQQPWAL